MDDKICMGGSHSPITTIVRFMVEHSSMPFISVEYRLAPEHPWPTGLEDCVQVAKWARSITTSRSMTFP